MTKTTRVLSGAAKDVFLEGVVRSALNDDHEARDRLLAQLTEAIASLRVRVDAERGRRSITDWTSRVLAAADAVAPAPRGPGAHNSDDAVPAVGAASAADDEAALPLPPADFDPYDPNVIVVLRTQGREAALSALAGIAEEAQLRLLAHEQQLGIPAGLSGLPAMREAIVAAAERRVANRRAAGS
jgi:hypothetical protein